MIFTLYTDRTSTTTTGQTGTKHKRIYRNITENVKVKYELMVWVEVHLYFSFEPITLRMNAEKQE